MTTLVYGATTITLPDDMLWTDEYAWRPVQQSRVYTLGGALLLESALRLAGRPITIAGTEASGWISRAVLDALQAALALPGQEFTLTLRGDAYSVVFDHDSGALEAQPVVDFSDPDDADHYVATARFLEI